MNDTLFEYSADELCDDSSANAALQADHHKAGRHLRRRQQQYFYLRINFAEETEELASFDHSMDEMKIMVPNAVH